MKVIVTHPTNTFQEEWEDGEEENRRMIKFDERNFWEIKADVKISYDRLRGLIIDK